MHPGSMASMDDERTPLILSKKRASIMRLPQTDQRDVWAELDDQENDNDVLASLPRTSSLFLRPRTRRRTSGSGHSQAMSSDSEQSDIDPRKSIKSITKRTDKRRSSMKGARSASAGHADKIENGDDKTTVTTRKRGNTVHFEETVRRAAEEEWEAPPQGRRVPLPMESRSQRMSCERALMERGGLHMKWRRTAGERRRFGLEQAGAGLE